MAKMIISVVDDGLEIKRILESNWHESLKDLVDKGRDTLNNLEVMLLKSERIERDNHLVVAESILKGKNLIKSMIEDDYIETPSNIKTVDINYIIINVNDFNSCRGRTVDKISLEKHFFL